MKLTGENRSTWGKNCPSATFSTTKSTWTDPGSNLGLRGEMPATNLLSHGTAKRVYVIHFAMGEEEKEKKIERKEKGRQEEKKRKKIKIKSNVRSYRA
jgi:hypothetical protein